MTTPTKTDLAPPRRRLPALVLAGWLATVALLLGAFSAGLPVRARQLLSVADAAAPPLFAGLSPNLENGLTGRLGADEAAALAALGLSPGVYAAYLLGLDGLLVLVCASVGLLIFWRRPDDWLTLWVSLILVLLGTNGLSLVVPTLITVWPGAMALSTGAGLLGMIGNVHLLFLSPDGRPVPRWTLIVAASFSGALLAVGAFTVLQFQHWGLPTSMTFISTTFPVWVAVLVLGLWSQVFRYRHISGPVQRQQTKWVALGLGAVLLGFVINALGLFAAGQTAGLARVTLTLARVTVANGCMALLPLCVAFSILRHRLWDIDVILRRTLIYSSLTAALVVVYLGSVVVLQALLQTLTGQRQSELVTVLSTLALAALVGPLRRRMQDFIDRRFFRRKYDAAQIIAAFSATVRDETDLDRLAERLVSVVDETMQPQPVGLWLRGRDERVSG